MRVDVADFRGIDAAGLEGVAHGAHRTLAFRLGSGEVIHVGGCAVTGDLRQDPSAALLGVLHVLQHKHHGALAHDKTVASDVEGAARLFGLVVPLARGLDLAESAHGEWGDGGLGTAGQHGDGVAALDDLGSFPDAVCARRAGTDDGEVRTAGLGVDGDDSRRHVGDHHRHGERADSLGPALQQRGVALLDLLHPADA